MRYISRAVYKYVEEYFLEGDHQMDPTLVSLKAEDLSSGCMRCCTQSGDSGSVEQTKFRVFSMLLRSVHSARPPANSLPGYQGVSCLHQAARKVAEC